VTNNVLDRALEVESLLGRLSEAVKRTSAAHQRDVMNETVAESEVETAYAALTIALHELASCTAVSKESLRKALAAQRSLEEFNEEERRAGAARPSNRPTLQPRG
jgi:hypothetical protein